MFETSEIYIYRVIKVDPAESTIPALLSTIIRAECFAPVTHHN